MFVMSIHKTFIVSLFGRVELERECAFTTRTQCSWQILIVLYLMQHHHHFLPSRARFLLLLPRLTNIYVYDAFFSCTSSSSIVRAGYYTHVLLASSTRESWCSLNRCIHSLQRAWIMLGIPQRNTSLGSQLKKIQIRHLHSYAGAISFYHYLIQLRSHVSYLS